MLYSLSATSLRTRYMTHTMTFPHKDVQQLTNVDYINNLAIVGTVPGVSGEEIVAIAQYFLDPKTQAAEVAFIVQDEWQQKGMGTFLLQYLCRDRQAARDQEVLRQGPADQQGDAHRLLQLGLQGQHRIRRRRLQHRVYAGARQGKNRGSLEMMKAGSKRAGFF